MADAIQELAQHNEALKILSELIPTRALVEYETSLNNIAVAYQKDTQEITKLGVAFKNLTAGTRLTSMDLARGAAEFSAAVNKTSMSVDQYARIATQAAKLDPINATRRIRDVADLARQYGTLTRGLDTNNTAQMQAVTAMRLSTLELQRGNIERSRFLLQMAEGRQAMGTFAERQAILTAKFQENRLEAGKFIGESKLLGSALDLVGSKYGSWLALAYGAKLTVSGGKSLLSYFKGGAVGAGAGAGAGASLAPGAMTAAEEATLRATGGLGRFGSTMATTYAGAAEAGGARAALGMAGNRALSGFGKYAKRAPLIGAAIYGYEAMYGNDGHQDNFGRASATGGFVGSWGGAAAGAAVGSMILPGIGTAIGAVVGGIGGDKFGRDFAEKWAGQAAKGPERVAREAEALEKSKDPELDRRRTIRERVEAILGVQTELKTALDEFDPTQQRSRALDARQGIVGQLASMGQIGPAAGMDIAKQKIDLAQEQITILTNAQNAFAAESANSAVSVAQHAKEASILIQGIQTKQLQETVNFRRGFLEQFATAASNAPSGTYTMPSQLSDRQKYGGSYVQSPGSGGYMTLENISGRKRQPRMQAFAAEKFQPVINDAIKSVGGFAEGGMVPGYSFHNKYGSGSSSFDASGGYAISMGPEGQALVRETGTRAQNSWDARHGGEATIDYARTRGAIDPGSVNDASMYPIYAGRHGRGLIPGLPSASDNRIATVATGEYIVKASAVSHYGAGLLDQINNKQAPKAGWYGEGSPELSNTIGAVRGFHSRYGSGFATRDSTGGTWRQNEWEASWGDQATLDAGRYYGELDPGSITDGSMYPIYADRHRPFIPGFIRSKLKRLEISGYAEGGLVGRQGRPFMDPDWQEGDPGWRRKKLWGQIKDMVGLARATVDPEYAKQEIGLQDGASSPFDGPQGVAAPAFDGPQGVAAPAIDPTYSPGMQYKANSRSDDPPPVRRGRDFGRSKLDKHKFFSAGIFNHGDSSGEIGSGLHGSGGLGLGASGGLGLGPGLGLGASGGGGGGGGGGPQIGPSFGPSGGKSDEVKELKLVIKTLLDCTTKVVGAVHGFAGAVTN